ncbi:addiction module toxin RelE [Pseudoduganella sp. FT55W]|uniref:Addiction module toxin RelE n=1 Tax=Duganella rivi TaxID=2666083 RepID=A0A7X4KAS9_9BURK|nr:transposase [Duganella rivi]MYM67386.1 addiction module toxin RelE [Duganella rivi]
MSRPLRLEFADAIYHVTARGDRQQAIYRDDTDRLAWLSMLASTCARFNFSVHSFCQMTNHYHLLLETGEANLSRGMRQLNGLYSQYFNRRHQVVGHLFQGRYKAILVQKDLYLRELARYVVLNPVRAGMVSDIADWNWSSYHFMTQQPCPPVWLQTDWILALFGTSRQEAMEAYRHFVLAGIGEASPIKRTRHQLILGDDAFVSRHRSCQAGVSLSEVTKEHRRAMALSLAEYEAKFTDRDMAIFEAYHSTAYTMTQIAFHFGIS